MRKKTGKKEKQFLEKIGRIYVSRHAVESWQEISLDWFGEVPQNAKKEIVKMLKQAREVEHKRQIYNERERIVYGQRARHFKFRELMIVTDQKLAKVITVFPVFYARCWRRKGTRRKQRRKGT